jgi:hypothetical protein
MKNRLLLSILLSFCLLQYGNSQDLENKKPWSFSVSYIPKIKIPRALNSDFYFYFLSFGLATDHKINEHFAYSLGLKYQYAKKNYKAQRMSGSYPVTFAESDEITLYEFPLQLNYHFKYNPEKFDYYLKTSLINSYYQFHYHSQYLTESYNEYDSKYLIFWDIGVGSYLTVNKRISIVGQLSLGFGLTISPPQNTYLECLVGLRYSL